MKIGVPKEIKTQEYRVGLTPESVMELTRAGHGVFVQTAFVAWACRSKPTPTKVNETNRVNTTAKCMVRLRRRPWPSSEKT